MDHWDLWKQNQRPVGRSSQEQLGLTIYHAPDEGTVQGNCLIDSKDLFVRSHQTNLDSHGG